MNNKPWEQGKLSVMEGRPYLVNGEKPFFWFGDTAWLLFQKTTAEEAAMYLRNRAEKGFSVIQATLVHSWPGENAWGRHAFLNARMDQPDESGTDSYWDHVEFCIQTAEKLGMYMGLLPHWGDFVSKGHIDEAAMRGYIAFLVRRFGHYPNIVWIAGGDTRGSDHHDYWKEMGELLHQLDPEHLVCFHPFGRTSSIDYFEGEDWLDVHMFQSGHRRYDQVSLKAWDDAASDTDYQFGEDNWRYVARTHAINRKKGQKEVPVLDAEPSYENIPHGLHDFSQPMWKASDVRRYAWWSVLEGACGFTYGHNAIMQFFDEKEGVGAYGCQESWKDAICHPGADGAAHLARLFRTFDFSSGRTACDLLAEENGEKYAHIGVFACPGRVLAYLCPDPEQSTRTIHLKAETLQKDAAVFWIDPRTGVKSYAGQAGAGKELWLKTPYNSNAAPHDWVLELTEED